MLEIDSQIPSQISFEPRSSELSVPRDVVNKYTVTSVKQTVEELITNRINEPEVEEAFYFVDLGCVVKKLKQWKELLPRVKPFYAMKCNPNPAIVNTLAGLDVNFDCASKNEIQQILNIGVDPSRIIYANPTKMKNHIAYAKEVNVDLMTFDNADELKKVAEIYPNAKLVLRIITDDSQSVCRFSSKFGTPLPQCKELLALAKSLQLNVVGVSFHVGSGCKSALSFAAAVQSAYKIFQEAERIGFRMTLLDLGGGWPGTDEEGVTFSEIANCIRPVLDELFPPHVQLIAEPGRFFVAQSHTLAVNVFAKRTIQQTGTNEKSFLYYINDGVYQSFNCIFFDHAAPKPEVFTTTGRDMTTHKSTIFGPTCDSMDCIARDIMLPELEVGEWIYFKNMGAYTVAAASPFNGFKSFPNTFYIESDM
jgi:ornithine decarboxylase